MKWLSTLFITLGALLIMSNSVFANEKDDEEVVRGEVEETKTHEVQENNRIEPMWVALGFEIANQAGNLAFNREPTHQANANHDAVSSGNINFNNGEYGSFAQKSINHNDSTNRIVAFAQTSVPNWLRTIETTIQNPNNSFVSEGSLTHNQQIDYTGGPTGNYQAIWNTTDNTAWDLWINYWHDEGVSAADSSANEPNFVETDIGTHVAPSSEHMQSASINNQSNDVLTLANLINETYDETLGMEVANLKNFTVGDSILFQEHISELEYLEEYNLTRFIFEDPNNEGSVIDFIFEGNLTNDYVSGDLLELEFEVSEIDAANNLEHIDYVIEASNGTPSIDDYQ